MWVGTFHGLAHRLLRAHFQEANLPENFQIIDSDDQQRLLRRILNSLNLDEKQYPLRQIQGFINAKKDEGIRSDKFKPQDAHGMTLKRIYQTYEELCQRSGLADFAELLLSAYEIFLKHPTVLAHYQQRFRHVLVDEFQDTNTIQYEWLKLLAGKEGHLTVVGDDDQSIYGWRGAEIKNILDFCRNFQNTLTVRLEENYRSTVGILAAADHVIANNSNRLGKQLKAVNGQGDPIRLYTAFNDLDEAHFLASQIKYWSQHNYDYEDIAVLYRSNAQSRVLEEALISANIPYRIYGGFRFFERAEIKDALAYLRLIYYRQDDAAFERIINMPTRGIGDQTLMTIREIA
jgi:DNA helicase II / ATP-dependent DNA helicase PcrA